MKRTITTAPIIQMMLFMSISYASQALRRAGGGQPGLAILRRTRQIEGDRLPCSSRASHITAAGGAGSVPAGRACGPQQQFVLQTAPN
jgi:hypothetical protein